MEKKEAMKILKDFHDKSALFSVRTALDTIIPELKESEDEKVRRELLLDIPKVFPHDKAFRYIAWLEKQGEHTSVTDLRTWKYIADYVVTKWCGIGQYLDSPRLTTIAEELQRKYYLEQKQGEQKPSWSEEDEKYLKIAIDNFQTLGNSFLTAWLKSLKNRVQPQPKQEWSEEDENWLINAINVCELNDYNETADWLKSLKSRVGCKANCTTARKWSGEDEELCEHLIKGIEELDPLPTSIYSDCKKWLKSLKDRYSWMPSEEYIDLINEAIGFFGAHSAKGMLMMDLRNNIKKLREE